MTIIGKKNLIIFFSASVAALLAIVLLPAFNTPRSPPAVADLVVTNAVIYTSDSSHPFAQAMAVRSGRILHVGNQSSVRELIGHGTRELNLEGKVVVPGFIDSHVHMIFGGLQMVRVVLRDVKSQDEFVRKVKEAVRDKQKDCWVLGGGWNNEQWGGDLPAASWIDDITTNNPVWLSRMDGHMGLANSLALKLVGITNCTEDPAGGTIMRTTDGEPTGLLVDSAMKLLLHWLPEVSVDERREALARASKHALMRGVTTVVDFGRFFPGAPVELVWEDFSDIYQWADSAGKMLVRVCLFFPMETWSRLIDLFKETGRALSQWIYLGGVKAFADGSLGSNSALFYEPYMDEPDNYGLRVTDPNWLLKMMVASDKSGLQVAVHAIGDKANDLILDLCDSVASSNGMKDRRFRIEHAQHLAPGAAARFGQQGVIASVQPQHLLDDADSAAKKLGVTRSLAGSYLFQSLLSGNACVAFGSDWPVADINPLGGLRAAMKRIPPGWEDAWMPCECVTLTDALNAHTISAAYASFLDGELGSLSVGKLADFVVLSVDSWEELAEVPASVLATYVGGVQAYP
ncbi:protein LONG AFTER FAR-RED 3 [Magnolia sinica]|uniref:protein LONG AFTER FAR-RED 3 n=1 Tax=Magnolia sinica TaxID=86752 RepID=UPI00265AF4B9|nr:protein LONG AFTER FAR-RED 3 [Magnolia sinica]